MSYVLANTGNPLGRRNLSRLGLGRMGWDNIPYPRNPLSRSVARLNGEFNPAGGDPSTNTHGAVTYRIDPRTGQYIFSRTDIKPRGVFMQNTFQHPAPPVMTPLGVRALPIGKSVTASTMQRGPRSRGPMIALRPGIQLNGLGCNCGGSCNAPLSGPRFNLRRRRHSLRGLGSVPPGVSIYGKDADGNPVYIDATGNVYDYQGTVLTDLSSIDSTAQGVASVSPGSGAQGVAAGIQQIVNTIAPRPAVVAPQPVSWFDQKTSIGGMVVSNPVLAAGAVGFAFLLAGMGGKRR